MRRDERGAVAVFTAFVLIIMMGVGALVVDLGLERVARADMQGLADIVSTELARDLDGRSVAEVRPVMAADAAAAVARNSEVVGQGVPVLDIAVGTLAQDGTFTAMSSGVPSAVRVVARTTVKLAFGGFTGQNTGTLSRAAVSIASSSACFRLGSFAAAIRSGDSAVAGVFERLLGSDNALAFNLGAIGYRGLLDTSIGLGALATQLGAGTPDALVAQGRISIKGLLSAGARVLDSNGQSQASAILADIAARVRSDITGNVGDMLSVGGGQAAGASINTIDFLAGAGLAAAAHGTLADQSNLLHTGVAWASPHASNGDIALNLIETPRQGCGQPGSATASTGQVELRTDIGFNLPSKVLGLLAGAADDPTRTQTSINVDARLGGASGALTGMSCTNGFTTRVRVDTRLVHLGVRLPFVLNGQIASSGIVPDALVPAAVRNVAKVDLHLVMTSSSVVETAAHVATADTVYAVPPHQWTDPEPSPGSSSSYVGLAHPVVSVDLSASTASLVSPLGTVALNINQLDLSSIVAAATASVIGTSLTAITDNLNTALTPVARLFGIRFAGADVFGVPTPTCAEPHLAG